MSSDNLRLFDGWGSRIVSARTSMRWSQAQLGEMIGKSKATIGRWETESHNADIGDLMLIARATRYSVEWLRTGQGPMVDEDALIFSQPDGGNDIEIPTPKPVHGASNASLGLFVGSAEGQAQTFELGFKAGEFIERWCSAFEIKPSERGRRALVAAAIATFMRYDVDTPNNLPAEVLGEFTAVMLKKYRTGDLDREGAR